MRPECASVSRQLVSVGDLVVEELRGDTVV
jgi:hypothetical protein